MNNNTTSFGYTPLPAPAEIALDDTTPVPFDNTSTVMLECRDNSSYDWLNTHFAEWYKELAPNVVRGSTGLSLRQGDEAYAIRADSHGIKIVAHTIKGVRWAAYTLRSLAIAKRGTLNTNGRILPTLTISDSPMLAFRCLHLCWIPPMTGIQIERAIRLAAQMKFNYIILEPWGMYKSEKNPWWCWPDAQMTKCEVRRLVAIGRDLGVTLIPQINVYGHGSSARSISLKHAVLDFHPEYEPLFEPGGWNWCLTNPETQRVLRELINEMFEDFDKPPFFHLGCDEAQPPTCPECRKHNRAQLVGEHLNGLANYVISLGARPMIWHDMLLDSDDKRWYGFVKSGNSETAKILDLLPKEVIICDWQYSYGDTTEVQKDWPTFEHFHSKGFPVAACPWRNFNAMKPMADAIARLGGFGIIETTWHHLRGNDWINMFKYGSSAAWGSTVPESMQMTESNFGNILRLVGHDMKLTNPIDTGVLNYQIPPSWWIDNN